MTVAQTPTTTDIYGQPLEAKPGDDYITHSKGLLSWALTLDHKRIGLMYLVAVLGAFAIGGFFAIFLRTMLLFGDKVGETRMGAEVGAPAWNNFYNQAFTLHGAIMVFMFIIPAIPAVLGNFALPLQLGAKDVAFPRLNLLSFYCWCGGSALLAAVLFGGIIHLIWGGGENAPAFLAYIPNGLDTGWTFYTPYSVETKTGVVFATLGAFILGFSSILTGLNFVATIHMLKPKGMGWFNMPLFLWAMYATAVIQVLATPVLAITLLLLTAEKVIGIGVFDPKLGGDPVLFQHFFWFYSHPAVYIMILPGLGVVSEIISVFSRKHIFGYKFIAYSSVAIALFGFIVWGHHMFTSGQSAMINAVFSLLTMSVAIPSAIKVFNWLATMYHGRIRVETPMLYAMGFIWLFTIGGLTGLFLAALSTDIYFHDTYFVVAHFHYVMVGSTLFAFLGGMYYWFPKMFGRMYNEKWGKIGWFLVFLGFNATFFIQFIAGSKGMPRRYATFLDDFTWYHHMSTGGSYILTIGLFVVLFNWLLAKRGLRAPANPWGGNQLEWHTNSPPPHTNFDGDPVGTDPYDYNDWKYDAKIDGYVLDPEHDLGKPEHAPAH